MMRYDDDLIMVEERTNGSRLCRLTVDPDGEAMITVETDAGPLRHVCMTLTRDDLLWLISSCEHALRVTDRPELEVAS